jgi:hypothetical protein
MTATYVTPSAELQDLSVDRIGVEVERPIRHRVAVQLHPTLGDRAPCL